MTDTTVVCLLDGGSRGCHFPKVKLKKKKTLRNEQVRDLGRALGQGGNGCYLMETRDILEILFSVSCYGRLHFSFQFICLCRFFET